MSWASANCTFISPRTPIPSASLSGRLADPLQLGRAERHRRQGAGRVAGVDAGLLDVLHDPAEVHLLAVVERVDVDLDRVVEEPVDEDRVLRADAIGRAGDVGGQGLVVVDDLHAAAAEDVGRAHEDRVADLARRPRRPRRRCRPCRASGAGRPASASTRPNAPRSSARLMASGLVPTIGTPSSLSACARPSGVWPPSCTMTPAIGPACCSAWTTSRTSSRVSGSK